MVNNIMTSTEEGPVCIRYNMREYIFKLNKNDEKFLNLTLFREDIAILVEGFHDICQQKLMI